MKKMVLPCLVILVLFSIPFTPLEIMPSCSAAGLDFRIIPAGFNAPMEFLTGFPLFAAKEVKVEVLYMNHGPLQSSLEQIKNIFSQYGSKISVSWYDFESKEGEQFMAKKGINQHVPLVIWMDGKFTIPVNGKEIKFVGFPTGSGPAAFQGKWTMDDLRMVLNQITNKPR
jgi:hypothetical protein